MELYLVKRFLILHRHLYHYVEIKNKKENEQDIELRETNQNLDANEFLETENMRRRRSSNKMNRICKLKLFGKIKYPMIAFHCKAGLFC